MRGHIALVVIGGLAALTGCSSESSHTANPRPATTSTVHSVPKTKDPQVWLCRPDQPGDPCLASLTTTVVGPDGARTVRPSAPVANPKIDCFYVYPTVSQQPTPNATLTNDPAERSVAIAQASRYSQVCRVFAPMYRQITIAGLNSTSATPGKIAFQDVLSAWRDYLDRYNNGRGVVLIGHSQGSFHLRRLISKYIDGNSSVRSRIVSAILLGGNVIVPTGKDVGGDFKHLGACHRASEIGCVIAFSAFDHTPPPNSLFGRARNPGEQVLCTNPAALAGGSGPADPDFPAHLSGLFGIGDLAGAATPWVSYPNLFRARCENVGGASWLQIDDIRKPGDNRQALHDSLGPTWGLHLYDGNIALENLTDIVRSEAAAYHANG